MLTALLLLSAMLVLSLFGNLNGLFYWLRVPRKTFARFLAVAIVMCFLPEIKVGSILSFNVGVFVVMYALGFAMIVSQHSFKEVIRVLIACCVSTVLLILSDSAHLMVSEFLFRYNFIIKLIVISLTSALITDRPGGALSCCILTPIIYDIYVGVVQTAENEITYLGSEFILQMIVYSMIGGVAAAAVVFPIRHRRRRNTLQFSQNS